MKKLEQLKMNNVISFPIPQRDRQEAFESYKDLLEERLRIDSLSRIQSNADLRCLILKLAHFAGRSDEMRKILKDEYQFYLTQGALTSAHGKTDLIDTLRMARKDAEKRMGRTSIIADGIAAPVLAEALNFPTGELDGEASLTLTIEGRLETPDVYIRQLENEWGFYSEMRHANDEPFEKTLARARKDAQ